MWAGGGSRGACVCDISRRHAAARLTKDCRSAHGRNRARHLRAFEPPPTAILICGRPGPYCNAARLLQRKKEDLCPAIGISLSRLRTLRDLFERRLKAASGKMARKAFFGL